MSRSICGLSLFIVKLIYLFIYYVSFFAAGYLFWRNIDMDIVVRNLVQICPRENLCKWVKYNENYFRSIYL